MGTNKNLYEKQKKSLGVFNSKYGVTVLGTQSAEFAIAVASAVLDTSALVSALTVCKRVMMRRMMDAQTMLALR
ncbi:MAG TPA: hypothetical protein VIP53_00990 [Nitrososphaera sp.]